MGFAGSVLTMGGHYAAWLVFLILTPCMVTMVFCIMFAYVGWSSRDTRAPVAPTICRC
jgi:uncharacterized membrane protein